MRRIASVAPLILIASVVATFMTQNLMEARNRSAQKQTMADMRSIATAWEARATDANSYLTGRETKRETCKVGCSTSGRPLPYNGLEKALSPTYIKKLPANDGWGHPFDFRADAQAYRIRSKGSDGKADNRTDTYANRTIESFEEDLVFADGTFIQYPEGT